MNIRAIKSWDKFSRKYRLAKWLYLNFFFYFINLDRLNSPRFFPRIIGGQEFDAGLASDYILPKDGPVIDVGAERGEFAYFYNYLGFKVYAIEPEKRNIIYLWLHSFLRILSGRLRIYRLACGETAGLAKLYLSDLSFRHSLENSAYSNGKVQEVKQVRIGDFINHKNIKKISLLKIDAEGYDLRILKGLFAATEVKPKLIIFEADKNNLKDLLDLVKQNGYNYFRTIARWPEQEAVSFQKRICVYEGLDPDMFEASGTNVICMQTDMRAAYPLKV
jgi:FkbM family methyltransferase